MTEHKIKSFKTGDIITRQSTTGEEMYVILSGRVKVYITINQEVVNLCELRENDFFGEMSLLLKETRAATVQAEEPTEVMILTMDNILQQMGADPEFAFRVFKTMARRLKEAHNVISRIMGEKKSLEIMYSVKPTQ